MTVHLHTPQGVVTVELTPQEVDHLAAEGSPAARLEIVRLEMPQHSDPHLKIDFLSWVLGIINTRPQLPGPP